MNRADLFTRLLDYYNESDSWTYGSGMAFIQVGPTVEAEPRAPYDEDGDSMWGSPCDVQCFYESRWHNGVKNRYQAVEYPENDLR